MSSLQVTGQVTRIDQPTSREYGDKTYTSQKFRVKTAEQYANTYEMEVREAKMSILQPLAVGQNVTAHINLKGREWEKDGKGGVFLSLDCWKVDIEQGAPVQTSGTYNPQQVEQDNQGLPF